MPEVLDFVNGKPVRRGTDSSADLQPSIPEEQEKPKAKPKPKRRPKGFLEQLQNDITYEFNQLQRDPVRSVMRAVGAAAPVAAGMALGMRSPVGTARPGMIAGAGAADNALRMGYSAFQRMTGSKKADPSRGLVGQVLDQNIDLVYRLAGETPPSQQNRAQRDFDMMRRSVALNLGLATVPFLGPGRALAATTKLGKVVKGATAFGLNEAASQFLDDNTGGGFMDLPNSVLPRNMQLPGGLGTRTGQLDMIDSAFATFGGNVAGGLAVGGGIGLAVAGVGALSKAFPATMRWLRGNRLKTEEVEARGRLTQAGVLEDNGDGAYRPGPAVAEAAPRKPATFAEADAEMRQRLGEAPDPDAAARAELDQVNQRLAQIDQQVADTVEPFGKAQPAPLPDDFDPDLDPWADFDPELPEATDVLKTLDQLDPAVIRQMDEAEGSITEMVAQAQQAQAGFQVNPNLRLQNVAAPTDAIGRLYLEGQGDVEPWADLLKSETVTAGSLRSLAHPSNSPELAARIEALTGKEWGEFTVGDIRLGIEALSREGTTVLPERLSSAEFMPTDQIAVDPERFQFKQGVDSEGRQIGASLSEEEFWNPKAEGVLEVWKDPADGKTYVVNGHNRLALAKRLGIPSVPVTPVTATRASSARAFGAIANIAQGQGNAFDAAKFIREAGITTPEQLKQAGMTGTTSWARDGLALSKLPEDLYRAAVNEEGGLKLRKAVIIGESGLPETGMRMLAAEVRQNPDIPDWELKEIGTMTASSPAVKARQGTIEGLENYGLDEGARQKVRLVRLVEEALRKDAKAFGDVAKGATRLEGKAANTIDRTGSKAVAEESNTALAAFGRMKYESGEVSDRLNRAAQQVADGEQPGAVARQVADEMPAILQRKMDAAMGRPAVPEVDPDQVDLFAPAEEVPVAPPPLTAAELEAAKARLVGRALKDGEARPNTTPIPELSEAPRVDPSEALADIEARGGIEADSPAMRALEDELRLVEEQALQDAAARQDAIEAMKDSYGYDELTFEEKKALGMTDGWEERLAPAVEEAPAAARAPIDPNRLTIEDRKLVMDQFKVDPRRIVDDVTGKGDGQLYAGEWGGTKENPIYAAWAKADRPDDPKAVRLYEGPSKSAAQRAADAYKDKEIARAVDLIEQARAAAPAAPVAPVRPVPLQLTQAAQPEFALPEGAAIGTPRYGRFTVAFDSDLDRAAYGLSAAKPPKDAPALRAAVEAAGLNPAAVAAHGAKVKAALKEAAKGKDKGELRVPRQPWGTGEVASVARAGSVQAPVSAADAAAIEQTLSKFVRLVGGPDATAKFEQGYVTRTIPPEWGGDGIEQGIIEGTYDYINDVIQINGLLKEPFGNLAETALHESYHRLQFMALTRKELEVLNTPEARRRVMMVAEAEGVDDISYLEAQTVAFQKYAIAKIEGKDPVAEIFKAAIDDEHPIVPVLAKIVSIFDKVADYVERFRNLAKGRGFNSIQSIFEKAQAGQIARRPRPLTQALGLIDNGDFFGKWVDNDTLGKPLAKVRTDPAVEIAAIDTQIAELDQRIAKEGC